MVIGLVKIGSSVLLNAGVTIITSSAVRAVVPKNMGKVTTLAVGVTSTVVGCMASEKVTKYAKGQIDEFVEFVKLFKPKKKETKEKVEE